jgi:hypothetical protein
LASGSNYVITDVRFPNEIEFLRDLDAKVVRVRRGPDPEWYETALDDNTNNKMGVSKMQLQYPFVHLSEWAWVGQDFDCVLENNSTLESLYGKVDQMLVDFATQS